MTNAPGNIIQNQVLDIRFNGAMNEAAARREAEDMNGMFLKRLEELFDKYDKKDEVIVIDSLAIDILCTSSANWKSEALSSLMVNIEQVLQQKQSVSKVIPAPVHRLEVLRFYLQHGYLPWWDAGMTSTSGRSFVDLFVPAVFEASREKLIELLETLNHEHVLHRFYDLFSEETYWTFVEHITDRIFSDRQYAAIWKQDIKTLVNALPKATNIVNISKRYKLLLLQSFTDRKDIVQANIVFSDAVYAVLRKELSLPQLQSVVKVKMANPVLQDLFYERSKPAADKTEDAEKIPVKQLRDEAGEEVIKPNADRQTLPISQLSVNNAGIIILANFLPQIFKKLEIAEKDVVLHVPKAVALLNYLVKGESGLFEYEAVLYKVLLGLDPEIYVDCNYHLSAEDKQEADMLLQTVISYWTVLKNTSVEGLRTSFLYREGKLSFDEEKKAWTLTIIQTAYDLLLHQLPWTISIIKLPWMKQLLKTEWT